MSQGLASCGFLLALLSDFDEIAVDSVVSAGKPLQLSAKLAHVFRCLTDRQKFEAQLRAQRAQRFAS